MLINDYVLKKLSLLKGERFTKFGRSGNLLWICFGKDAIIKTYKNTEKIMSQYGINVSSYWRIVNQDNILLASYDFYLPSHLAEYEDEDEWDWDEDRTSIFDVKREEMNEALQNDAVYVKDFQYNNYGDLKIELSNDTMIEIYTNSSEMKEHWRLMIVPGIEDKADHLVIFEEED